jgi:hypothetical protein
MKKCPVCGMTGMHKFSCTEWEKEVPDVGVAAKPVAPDQASVPGTPDAPPPPKPERLEDRRLHDVTQVALAVTRIVRALVATRNDISIAALATVVGQFHYNVQKDAIRRRRNIEIFVNGIEQAITMEMNRERQQAEQRDAARDPVRRLDS